MSVRPFSKSERLEIYATVFAARSYAARLRKTAGAAEQEAEAATAVAEAEPAPEPTPAEAEPEPDKKPADEND